MKKYFLLLSLVSFGICSAQQISGEKTGKWKKFEKIEFMVDSFPAWYVKPAKPIAGNPWVWRAHFPNWHTEMDSILLERGFHIAYINTNNLYAHPKAMMAWDKFYNYLVEKKGFAPKVALEGVSRGALYVYGWAKRNPAKVSCIYTEAAVCDFKSWPAGKGKGKGDTKEWKKLLDLYGFTEEQALQFNDQPKDDLAALAAFKVPILHTIGLTDSIVPAEENTFVLVNNYVKAGGPATVVPMTKGKQELGGHHFPIEDPASLADFIYRNSVPVSKPLRSENFAKNYGDLNNILSVITGKKAATVAFLGGSITTNPGWRNKVMQYLQELFPDTKFNFINAGIASLGSMPHAFRVQEDVLDKGKIDLLFFESAVNDKGNGTTELQQRRAIEGVIRHAYATNPYLSIIMMAFADEAKMADYNNGKIPLEVQVHEELSKYYHLPFINLAEEVTRRIANKEFTWEDDFKNIHPSRFGQEIYFNSIKNLLQKEFVGKTPRNQVTVKLPPPLQSLNYANAFYVPVNKITNAKDFNLHASWTPLDSVKTREFFVNVPMLVGEKPGASFDFTFIGTTVGIAAVSGPDAGTISYSIDGRESKTLDTYNRYSKSLHLPQYFLLGDDLKKGKHTLHIEILQEHNAQSKGKVLKIAHFLVAN